MRTKKTIVSDALPNSGASPTIKKSKKLTQTPIRPLQLGRKQPTKSIVNLDMLIVNLLPVNADHIIDLEGRKGLVWINDVQLQQIGGKMGYKYSYNVIYEGIKLGIYSNGSLRTENKLHQFKFANHLHYVNTNYDYLIELLCSNLNLTFDSYNKLDIANDLNNNEPLEQLQYIYESCVNSPVAKRRKKKGIKDRVRKYKSFINQNIKSTGENEMLLGDKKKKHILVYDKGQELKERNHKKYITDIHQQELGTTDVCRVELRLTGKDLKKYPITLSQLQDKSFLRAYFELQGVDLLQFKDVTSHYWDKNNNKKARKSIIIVPMELIKGTGAKHKIRKEVKINDDTIKLNENKRYWKSLVRQVIVTGKNVDEALNYIKTKSIISSSTNSGYLHSTQLEDNKIIAITVLNELINNEGINDLKHYYTFLIKLVELGK